MGVASEAFQIIAGFIFKLGLFICLPAGIFCYWFANSRQFEVEHTKSKIIHFGKIFLLLFAGSTLPLVLVKVLGL